MSRSFHQDRLRVNSAFTPKRVTRRPGGKKVKLSTKILGIPGSDHYPTSGTTPLTAADTTIYGAVVAGIGYPYAFVGDISNRRRRHQVIAHEIGHTLYLQHNHEIVIAENRWNREQLKTTRLSRRDCLKYVYNARFQGIPPQTPAATCQSKSYCYLKWTISDWS